MSTAFRPISTLSSEVGDRHGLHVYFDSAQGLGAEFRGRKAGIFGMCEVFSLSPTKVVTAVEGGVISTNDSSLAARLRSMRDYGKDPVGRGGHGLSRPLRPAERDSCRGGIAVPQRLDELVKARQQLIDRYQPRGWVSFPVATCRRSRRPNEQRKLLRPVHQERARMSRDEVCAAPEIAGGSRQSDTSILPLHEQTLFQRVPSRRQ